MIGQVGDHWGNRTLLIGDPRGGNHCRIHRRVGNGLVATDTEPFRAALGHTRTDHAYGFGQRLGGLHPRSPVKLPGQLVHALQSLVKPATVFVGFHDDHELVTGEPVILGNEGIVAVVA
ncbi:hypothetical protein D3C78_1543440 [compost metagenome]